MLVDLEVDAREAFSETLDVSRTVGWFTSRYPLLIDGDIGGDRAAVAALLTPVLSRISDAHRRIRRSGIAYGALRAESSQKTAVRNHLRGLSAEVAYLYLGGLRREPVAGRFAPLANAEQGRTCADDAPRAHVLEIAAEIEDGRLVIEWTYSRALHDRAAIETVAHRALALLEGLIVESGSQDSAVEGDFADSGLDSDNLSRLLRQLQMSAGDDEAGDPG
jgi:non-ribosomal peptide synthase protein (TIGR01720 family)